MRAITIVDGRLEWCEQPDPVPRPDELLVAVEAAGVNRADLLQRDGRYPAPPGSPADIPGLEFAGRVIATGIGVSAWAPGDWVMAVVGGGGHAELAVVHERLAIPVPDNVALVSAGGFPEAFATAYDALFALGELTVGERVCVHGAAGGVGVAAVQLAVAAGADVVASVRNPELRARVAALGATVVEPASFETHGPFDVIVELVGGPNLARDVAALREWGRIVVIGVGAGATVELDLFALMSTRGTIVASTLRSRSLEQKAALAQRITATIVPLLAAGRVHVAVDGVVPMADAAAAYERFDAGGKFGKIVLVTSTPSETDQ